MITTRKDQILGFSSDPNRIKKMSMQVINVLQDYKRGDIGVALAVLWLMYCERFDVNPSDVMGVAHRMRTETFHNHQHHQFKAIKEYMEHEL